MTTYWIVVGVLLVSALAAMLVHDRRAKMRAARLGQPGPQGPEGRSPHITGNPNAYRSSPGSHPTGWRMGSGN